MYLRRCRQSSNGRTYSYWKLIESFRTARGPRQRVVAYLGDLGEADRLGVAQAASGNDGDNQRVLFDSTTPRFVQIDTNRLRVENVRAFGGAWLALQLIDKLGLRSFFDEVMPTGQEEIPWSVMALVLVIGRLLDPSSELRLAEHLYERTALPDLLGVPVLKVNDDRLYRGLDKLLPHKDALQTHLKNRLGELFDLKYDLLLYDVTSTYFEGQCSANPLAARGYSRDQRFDCKQVCIALVVSRDGMPVGYELFAGNRSDVTTVEEIVTTMEGRYGKSDRIWVMDRGMTSEDNIAFLKQENRRYIIGTPKSMLKKYERELLKEDWSKVRDGLEVKLCTDPQTKSDEAFILCRSSDRAQKERAMHDRFEKRIEEGLTRIAKACAGKKKLDAVTVSHRVGKLLGQNTRAAGAYKTSIETDGKGRAMLKWEKVESWGSWARLSEGCYLLRSNVREWSAEELWHAYMQLTQAESAFRIHKSDLSLRPVWHQKQKRVEAHVLVCFLAYVLWKTLAQWCKNAGLGDEPRKVLDEIAQVTMVDVVLPTKAGPDLIKRCIAQASDHQKLLLHHLKLNLPTHLEPVPM
jgi:transposase